MKARVKLTMKNIVALASVMLACFVSIADDDLPWTVKYTVNGYAGDRIKAEYDSMASGDFLTAGPSTAGRAKCAMIIVW
ncbi:MAG: hypothetical protein IJG18_07085 [Kiritimatiellae bacterium]|nr:hypothetical protein [Kiritimatiellia bacterium]